jgi:hypothetical protein
MREGVFFGFFFRSFLPFFEKFQENEMYLPKAATA